MANLNGFIYRLQVIMINLVFSVFYNIYKYRILFSKNLALITLNKIFFYCLLGKKYKDVLILCFSVVK